MALNRLREIIATNLLELDRVEMTNAAYENPAWAFKQAHQNGVRKAYTSILDLLEFLDPERN